MTPTTVSNYDDVGPGFTGGASRRYLPPVDQKDSNKAEDKRKKLDLPFGAGPSGTMVYALAMFYDQRNNVKLPPLKVLAVSLAAYLVRHGHHSFFEALEPLNIQAKSKMDFYLTIRDILHDAGYKNTAFEIRTAIINSFRWR
jgi:hypothetical protein